VVVVVVCAPILVQMLEAELAVMAVAGAGLIMQQVSLVRQTLAVVEVLEQRGEQAVAAL